MMRTGEKIAKYSMSTIGVGVVASSMRKCAESLPTAETNPKGVLVWENKQLRL